MSREREQFEIVREQYLQSKNMITISIQLLQQMKIDKPENISTYEQQEQALKTELLRMETDHSHNIRIYQERQNSHN